MGQILQSWRISVAVLFSLALIAGAYFLAKNGIHPPIAEASTEAALLQAIASKDSDADGLPDWEEALYGTSPTIADTNHLGMTDGEAVAKGLIVPKAIADIATATSSPASVGADGLPPAPRDETLTAAFAKNFFTLYLAAKQKNGGVELSANQTQALQEQILTSLSSAIDAAPDYKTMNDLTIAHSGPEALKAFVTSAQAVFKKNAPTATKSEITYLTAAIQKNDARALAQLTQTAKEVRNVAVGLSVLPVPAELATGDLAFINALMRMSEIVADFSRINDDPLTTMMALQQYVPAAQTLNDSFAWFAAVARLSSQQNKL